jgi:hypothetical protein
MNIHFLQIFQKTSPLLNINSGRNISISRPAIKEVMVQLPMQPSGLGMQITRLNNEGYNT